MIQERQKEYFKKPEAKKLEANQLTGSLGFVLLFSLLISSILLATGLGISRLMVRQIFLASLSRDSQVAFFAADSGMECALHWESFGLFDKALDQSNLKSRTIYCTGGIIKDGVPGPIVGQNISCDPLADPPRNNIVNGSTKSCFSFPVNPGDSPEKQACALVVVDKSDSLTTKITANGYNRCNLNTPNSLQRTLEITLINF